MIPTTSATPSRSGGSSDRNNKNSVEALRKAAMQSVSTFNKQLNQERKEERGCSMDLQTYTINYPVGLGVQSKQYQRYWQHNQHLLNKNRVRDYPLAVLPEQYQDNYNVYNRHQKLGYPLSKAMYIGDISKLSPEALASIKLIPEATLSDIDDDLSDCDCHLDAEATKTTTTTKSTPQHIALKDDDFLLSSLAALKQRTQSTNTLEASTTPKPASIPPGALEAIHPSDCRICKTSITMGSLLQCSDCGIASHAACIDITGELLEAIRLYKWQCTDCKVCTQCRQPHDEEKMMFCDKCDRGYHTYCVGLTAIPDGHWVCSLCAACAGCGTKNLIKIGDKLMDWEHEVIHLSSSDGTKLVHHKVFCHNCYLQRKR